LGKENLVSWITTGMKKREFPLPKIITREEMLKLVQACKTIRNKALIYTLFESGARIGELLNLKINEVEFDSYGAVLIINKGKTGSRRIRICGKAAEYLKEWIYVNHPDKKPDSKVFPVTYRALSKALKLIAKKAGLNKRITFHMFRHGRATELASKLTEMELDIFMGWELSSRMPRIYCHLSGKDIEKKILQISGITKEEQVKRALANIKIKKPELFRALVDFVKNELKESS
jgi:integrase